MAKEEKIIGGSANIAQWGRSCDVRDALLLDEPTPVIKRFPLASLQGRAWSPEEILDFTLSFRVDPEDRYTTSVRRSPFRIVADVGNGATTQRFTWIPRLAGDVRHFIGSSVRAQLEVDSNVVTDVPTDHFRIYSDIAKGRPSPWIETQYPDIDFDPEAAFATVDVPVPAWAQTCEAFVAPDIIGTALTPYDFTMFGPEGGPVGVEVPAAIVPEGSGFPLAPWCRAVRVEVPDEGVLALVWRGVR